MTTIETAFAPAEDRSFFGHPRGLAYLAFTEAWERFSFYGMSGLLLLYLIQRLLTPEVMGGVLGLGAFRSVVEAVTGPLSNQAFASQIYGLYGGLVYFTPMFGGLLADRLLGQRRTVMLGALLMSGGHILMAFDASFLIAAFLLVTGSGCLKGNISAQVGHLYPKEDESRRTRAFAIFSASINFGALTGPLVCAVVAQIWGWHAGFGVASVLMLAALATYVAGRRYLPPDRKRGDGPKHPPLTARDYRIVAGLILVSALAVFPSIAYYQESNAGILMIEESVSRGLFGWTVPTSAFNALDGFFCIVLVPPLVRLWRGQARRGREPGDMSKIAIGFLVTAVANLAIMIPAGWIDADPAVKVSMLWPVALFGLNALGFLYYWPTLLALFSRAAPAAVNATLMGVLFFSLFFANVLIGTFGGWWEEMSHTRFFAFHAALAIVPCAIAILLARPFGRLFAPVPGRTQ
ncbi:MAG: peptide MFS transporter [Candidatus Andeanibacterium colombiense]|uniref:Peptide MFS transporter n=1 Tax=Candidatus Andeanibacterium colombiense TaxID=3121345 RepID=A0AAJ5X0P7_9SPHN|nr:MAG: peptide MFS transporter [Sphingomonadaceae bacterium]